MSLPAWMRRDEVQDVLVLGRRDQHGVDALVVQQLAEVLVGLDLGREFLHFIQAARVDIRHGGGFRVGALQGRLEDLLAPAARADQADANALVGSQDTAGWESSADGQRRSAGQHIADKLTTGRHKILLRRLLFQLFRHDQILCTLSGGRQGRVPSR